MRLPIEMNIILTHNAVAEGGHDPPRLYTVYYAVCTMVTHLSAFMSALRVGCVVYTCMTLAPSLTFIALTRNAECRACAGRARRKRRVAFLASTNT